MLKILDRHRFIDHHCLFCTTNYSLCAMPRPADRTQFVVRTATGHPYRKSDTCWTTLCILTLHSNIQTSLHGSCICDHVIEHCTDSHDDGNMANSNI